MFQNLADEYTYLTIILSNCTYQGSSFLSVDQLSQLKKNIRNFINDLEDFEFRGVGCSMVRGNTNSLTLGISAGYFFNTQKLTDSVSSTLRVAIRNKIADIQGLAFSQIRIETSYIGRLQ